MKTLFSSKVTIFFISLSLSLMILLGFSLASVISIERPIKVVDLTSLTQDEALSWAQENQLKLEVVTAYDEDLPTGSILSQTIGVGERLYADSSLTITVSSGPDPDKIISLVDFTGKDIGEVQTFIDSNKLTNASIAFEKSTLIQPAFFMKKSVDSPTIKRSDTIVFTISSGDQTELTSVSVPDFSNYTKQQITSWATTSNVKVNIIEAFSSNAPAGSVFEQSLAANSSVYNGSSLTVKISLGAGVVLENLVGKSKSDIETFISSKGLKVVYTSAYSSTVSKDLASSMSPSATTRVADGSTVNITLSLGKVSVKDFTGKTQKELDAWIADVNKQGANLKSTSSSEYSATVTSGALISQTPSSGDVNPGSSISVKVSKGEGITVGTFTYNSEQEGLKVTRSYKYHSSSVNTVISQDPAPGTKVDANSTVSLIVSLGNTINYNESFTTFTALQNWVSDKNSKGASITLNGTAVNNSNSSGTLISFSPTSSVAYNGSISASYSRCVFTPTNFVNSSVPNPLPSDYTKSEEYSTASIGTVIRQSSTSAVDCGTKVNLVVSKGQDPATLPVRVPYISDVPYQITSSSLSVYKEGIASRFTNLNLVLIYDEISDSNTSCGMISRVTPSENTTVTGGSTVTVRINTYGCN